MKALSFVSEKDNALDVGAGALVDSRALLDAQFKLVTAIDADEASRELALEMSDTRFSFIQHDISTFEYPAASFDIVSGQYTFSFLNPTVFEKTLCSLFVSLKSEGVFTGNFFGVRDDWNTHDSKKTFLDKDECLQLFNDFTILYFNEVERDSETALGLPKHWHEFEVIARR